MPKPDILVKNENGEFDFSEYGIQECYFQTVYRILYHYMKAGMKLPEATMRPKLAQLRPFLNQNFHSLDDFLDKLDLLSGFIGEQDVGRFGAYFGKHFVSLLEQIKNQLREKELPRAKHKYDNPYRVPSDDFLEEYRDLFLKAPPLNLSAAAELTSDSSEKDESQPTLRVVPKKMPGEIFLEQFKDLFIAAPALSLGSDDSAESEEDAGAGQASSNTTTKRKEELPGVRLLNLFRDEFLKSMPAEESNDELNLVSFKEFVDIVSKLSRFQKTQDKEGYRNWYLMLLPTQQALVLLYNQLVKERKKVPVDWDAVFQKASAQFAMSETDLRGLKTSVQRMQDILIRVQQAIRSAMAVSQSPQSVQAIYSQVVALLADEKSKSEKKTALKMLLLQVPEQKPKDILRDALMDVIDRLAGN